MLIAFAGVTGLGTGIDTVENVALAIGVIAGFLIGLRPVGILDDDLAVGVGCLGGLHDKLLADPGKLLGAELFPAHVTLCLAAFVAGAVGEEPVVDDELVKVAGGIGNGLYQILLHCLIGIAVCTAE